MGARAESGWRDYNLASVTYNHGVWQASLLNLFQASAPLMKSRSRSAHLKGSWFPESPLSTHHRLDTVLGLENCGKPKTVLTDLLCSRLWPRFAEKTRHTLVPHRGGVLKLRSLFVPFRVPAWKKLRGDAGISPKEWNMDPSKLGHGHSQMLSSQEPKGKQQPKRAPADDGMDGVGRTTLRNIGQP